MLLTKNVKITNPIEEVLNFLPDDNADDIKSEISEDNCTNRVVSQFNVNDLTIPFSNSITTPQLDTYGPKKVNARFMSLEDQFNSKISALKAYLIKELYDQKKWNEIIMWWKWKSKTWWWENRRN